MINQNTTADRNGSMNQSVLITGAAGFLGTQVTRLILEQTRFPVIVLIRGRNADEARHRLERIWWDWPETVQMIGTRIHVIVGDLCLPRFGLDKEAYEELADSVSHILHLAADIRLNEPISDLRRINVEGVRTILALASHIHGNRGLDRLSYVSTAYVAGERKGIIPEEELTDRYGFSNAYEQSKFEGESLIREAAAVLPVSIFRPGMVVGDSKSGVVKTFNTLYYPLRLYMNGKLKIFPVNPNMKINMIPFDYVTEPIARLTFDREAEGKTFHLTLPPQALPTVGEMIHFTRGWAFENLHVKLPKPVFLPLPVSRLHWMGRFFPEKSAERSLLSLASYFEEDRIYRRDNLDQLMGSYQGSWMEFFPQLLSFAVSMGFMHRSERTVHEQIVFRLSRKSRPVGFHDIVHGDIKDYSAEEISKEIKMTVSAMRRMGIQPGDRIAIVGYNCARYAVIDAAAGLCGAVSVPLYYSSPVEELKEIISDSGSRMIFVGVPNILKQLKEADPGVPVISFCMDGTEDGQAADTLKEDQCELRSSSGFGDLATLRYTSGTTGLPKGAAFDHANLRSMAESLASLPPWKARNRKLIYLSFLPMNHVVEGILASYAIFYAPAPVEIYYLQDFAELQKILPKVCPTVFFSVPRFYEKVWDQASQSRVGKLYLQCRNKLCRKLLGRILRLGLIKGAGIRHCSQLIVGSAPISAELLQNYREIGIEIHNAYGLTEAPLVTLNRYKSNRIGTVGEPLPDTELRIAKDGEILVRGPQVMRGYYHGHELKNPAAEAFPLEDGWLYTGDLGSLTDDDYLVLSGRKKEGMINSYGKNINPVKIELMLREVSGINHVMVCGDNRPYCAAIFWGCPENDQDTKDAVESGIRRTNERLSHPEQIKKWVLLADELTVEEGGLTANLKIKRLAVMQKYAQVIEALYKIPERK